MAWENRGAKRYLYVARRVGGRVIKTYVGNHLAATLAASMLQERRQRRRRQRAACAALTESLAAPLAAAEAFADYASQMLVRHLTELGMHNPGSRGWRFKRRRKYDAA